MTILGHKSASMSMIYSRISDPEVRRQYESALASENGIAGPAAEAPMNGRLDDQAIHWLQANFLKTRTRSLPTTAGRRTVRMRTHALLSEVPHDE
jgi:murein L,D-transpeptidase YcbB/YkuD